MQMRVARKDVLITNAVPARHNPVPLLQSEDEGVGAGVEPVGNSRIMEFMSPNSRTFREKGIVVDALHNRIAVTLRFGPKNYLEGKYTHHRMELCPMSNSTAQKHQAAAFRIDRQSGLHGRFDRVSEYLVGGKLFEMGLRKSTANVERIDFGQRCVFQAGNPDNRCASVFESFKVLRVVKLKRGIPDYPDFNCTTTHLGGRNRQRASQGGGGSRQFPEPIEIEVFTHFSCRNRKGT